MLADADFSWLAAAEPQPTLAIAVSGGADSMALLLLAKAWADTHDASLIALTVDHKLRPEAQEEARQVAHWAAHYGIEHHILTWEGALPSANIMAEARNIRYSLLTRWCHEHHILHLLTAHHRDDQEETFLLRLQRGSGIDGLAAIASVSTHQGVMLVRPLLAVPKQELITYLESRQQPWIEDPTNQREIFTRNRLRALLQDVQPDAPVAQRLADTAQAMARARASLEQYSAAAAIHCIHIAPGGYALLNLPALFTQPEEIILRLLCNSLLTIGGRQDRPRMDALQAFHKALTSADFTGATLAGCECFLHRGNCYLIRELGSNGDAEDPRFRHPHHKVQPLGKAGWLAIADEIKTKLPKRVLYTLPALRKKIDSGVEIIIEVPHISYRRPDEDSLLPPPLLLHPAKPLAALSFGCYSGSQ